MKNTKGGRGTTTKKFALSFDEVEDQLIRASKLSPTFECTSQAGKHKQSTRLLPTIAVVLLLGFGLFANSLHSLRSSHSSVDNPTNTNSETETKTPGTTASLALALNISANPIAQVVLSSQSYKKGLSSSLYAWRCSNEGQSWQQSILDSKKTLNTMKRYKQKNSTEAGGRMKYCKNSWKNTFPDISRIDQVRSRKHDKASITLAVQLPIERRDILKAQCTMWPGQRIAAAFYIPLVHGRVSSHLHAPMNGSSLDAAVSNIYQLHAEMESLGERACSLDIVVLAGERCSWEAAAALPVNGARNRALMLVQTPLVLLMNSDSLASASIASVFSKDETYLKKVRDTLRHTPALVLPGFATKHGGPAGQKTAGNAAMGGRQAAIELLKEGALEVVSTDVDVSRWSKVSRRTFDGYAYDRRSEPAVIMAFKDVPWFDESITGYASTRVLHLGFIQGRLGSDWKVFPDALTVRVPPPGFDTHPAARKMRHKQEEREAKANTEYVKTSLLAIKDNKYTPIVTEFDACYNSLPN